MTTPATTEAGPDARLAEVADVADTFVGLARSFTRARARLLAAAAHDVEWSAHVILRELATEGPMRASALAERIESDPSTVSRQVAGLVKEGLVERRADPIDGRAALLVPTARAEAVLQEHNAIRLQHFDRMLSEWSERDLHRFAEYLARFTEDFDRVNDKWINERVAQAAATERL
jgi:DNA-binding MarR family transcriptional regulator